MGFGLEAPVAVPIEIRAEQRRVFRLASSVGDKGLRLEQPAPFEPGRPVEVRFALPDAEDVLTLGAEVELVGDPAEGNGDQGGCGLRFYKPHPNLTQEILRYVAARLGMPQV